MNRRQLTLGALRLLGAASVSDIARADEGPGGVTTILPTVDALVKRVRTERAAR